MLLGGKIQRFVIVVLTGYFIWIFSIFSGEAFASNSNNENLKEIVEGNNEFALKLYDRIKELPQIKAFEGNLFISPYSISNTFAMVYSGARGNTAKEMGKVFCFPSLGFEQVVTGFGDLRKQLQTNQEAAGFQLYLANSLWGRKGYAFLPEFLELNKKYFDAGLNELDFAKSEEARKTINTWVKERTKEKIRDLIPAGIINGQTRLVLTNAIYFKGNWVIPFKEENTKPAKFNVTEEKKVEVQMMYQKESCKYAKTDDMELLELPYGLDEISVSIMEMGYENGNNYGYSEVSKLMKEQLKELPNLSMLIILPKSINDLVLLEKRLNPQMLQSNTQQMKLQEIKVYLPKFKMTCGTIELKNVLIEMGMKEAFKEMIADFSGINGRRELFISNVLHKTFVEVNEKGTEAAAASALRISIGLEPPPPVFRVDRPFIFIIRDNKTGSILFMGRLVNPSLQG